MAILEFRVAVKTTLYGPCKVERTEYFSDVKNSVIFIDELACFRSPFDATQFYNKIITNLMSESNWCWKVMEVQETGPNKFVVLRPDSNGPWDKLLEKFLND